MVVPTGPTTWCSSGIRSSRSWAICSTPALTVSSARDERAESSVPALEIFERLDQCLHYEGPLSDVTTRTILIRGLTGNPPEINQTFLMCRCLFLRQETIPSAAAPRFETRSSPATINAVSMTSAVTETFRRDFQHGCVESNYGG